jgi:hypothetical protein
MQMIYVMLSRLPRRMVRIAPRPLRASTTS